LNSGVAYQQDWLRSMPANLRVVLAASLTQYEYL